MNLGLQNENPAIKLAEQHHSHVNTISLLFLLCFHFVLCFTSDYRQGHSIVCINKSMYLDINRRLYGGAIMYPHLTPRY
jgi:hypothetical protein